MCGISGIWSQAPVTTHALLSFNRSMASRGPDSEGYQLEDNERLGLGHRRLAILDPSPAGHQPMSFHKGRYWLTYNGEIFNFLELRKELEKAGYQFISDTDSEVILAAFIHWGESCQLQFNGMWAFAIWDRIERSLFISRDRFGIKPLFFASTHSFFSFASEVKAFLFLEGFNATIRMKTKPSFGVDSGFFEETQLENVFSLNPGHSLHISGPNTPPKPKRWWFPHKHLMDVPKSYHDQVDIFRELFIDSCKLQLRSDIPLASSVSGGIDSSSVFCMLTHLGDQSVARRPKQWQNAFFADAPGSKHSDADRPYAELVMQSANCKPKRLNLWHEPIANDIELYLLQTEGLGSLGNYWSWALYRKIKQAGITVTLDGQGADELLCGYPHMIANSMLFPKADLKPFRALRALRVLHGMQTESIGEDFTSKRLLALWLLAANPITQKLPGIKKVLQRYACKHNNLGSEEEKHIFSTFSPIEKIVYQSVCYQDLPPVLRFFDIISMSHGVEVRMPFMDWRLISFALSLPGESYLGNGFTKRILRDAMRNRIPEAVRKRKDKVGFARPVSDILRGPLREWALEQVHKHTFVQYPYWDGRALRKHFKSDDPKYDRLVWQAIQHHWRIESWTSKTKAHFVQSPSFNQTSQKMYPLTLGH